MQISSLLTALGIAPKTLPQALDQIAPARAQLDSIAALFTAAGLPLEEMLAAGPESLKAHLASLDQSETIAALTAEKSDLAAQLEAASSKLQAHSSDLQAASSQLQAFSSIASTLGIPATDTPPTAEAIDTAFKSHIAQAASTLLAKDGRPPVAHVAQGTEEKKPAAAMTDAEHRAAHLALPEGSKERAQYAAKHYDALARANRATPEA